MVENAVLVDSSIWIEGIDPKCPREIKSILGTLLEAKQVMITDIIRLEVIGGARSVTEFERYREEFQEIYCLEITSREWRMAEDYSFLLGRKGQRIPAADILIVAVAVSHGIPLWHVDSDFERVRSVVSNFKTYWYPKSNPSL